MVKILYFFGHGNYTPFKSIWVWLWGKFPFQWFHKEIYPQDVSANIGKAKYQLVFLNACDSADPNLGSNAQAFAKAFNTQAYVGWDATQDTSEAVGDGEIFFQQLANPHTVEDAVAAVNSQADASSTANLTVVGNGAVTIDMTPPQNTSGQ
jgi:hypothetical protein